MTSKKNRPAQIDLHALLPRTSAFLVVDDDPDARTTVAEYLSSYGYDNILQASNGNEAMQALKSINISFIISDWEMPGMAGLDLLRAVKMDDALKNTPFLIITSPDSHENLKIQEAGVAAVDGYVIKPFRAATLRTKIEDVLDRKRFESRRAALVVEDDPAVRSLVKEILESMTYAPVFEVPDGEEAISLLKDYDTQLGLVISDWEMPNVSGIELLRRMKLDKELAEIPFIMITSQVSRERLKLEKALEAEVDHYLMKPFKIEDLRTRIRLVVEQAKLARKTQRDLSAAQHLMKDGALEDAQAIYERILDADPRNIPAFLGLAKTHLSHAPKQGYEEAVALIREAIRLGPKRAETHLTLAQALESNLSLAEAANVLRTGLESCPLSDDLHYELGRILLRRGNVKEGEESLRRALEINPNRQDARDLLAEK